MFTKTITYTDYNGEERTEEFRFNMTRTELLLLDGTLEGGLEGTMEYMRKTNDLKGIAEIFENLVQSSYGIKSADGRRFIKNNEVLDAFVQSPAYDALIFELITKADTVGKEFLYGLCESIRTSGKLNDQEHQSLQVVTG